MLSVKDEYFIAVYNDVERFETLKEVAKELSISVKTVANKATYIRKIVALDDSQPNLIYRKDRSTEIPMSEDESRFMEDWTAEDCIEELRRVASLDPDIVVSRNFFRVNSAISESTWNRFFGTFEEFKRQADLKLSRQQHVMERHIAKHASADHYRELSDERRCWGDKYEKGNDSRYKTLLVGSDFHDIEVDAFFLRVFIDTARRIVPDVIVLAGDIFDLAEFGRYDVDPREWDVIGRIKFVHDNILRPLREACPDSQIDFIEGNHENRLLKHMADATPALKAVLSELHGFTVPKLLGLDEFEINYVARSDLSAYTKRDQQKELEHNYKIYWDSFLIHHFPHARNMGLPGLNGHHHQHQMWGSYSPVFGPYEWHQLGCGHKRKASYCEGEKWHNGFAVVHIDTDTKQTNVDYIPLTDICVAGGKWHYREEGEKN